ncbi:hypothetical protein Gotur_032010 [Gossypium turneri]
MQPKQRLLRSWTTATNMELQLRTSRFRYRVQRLRRTGNRGQRSSYLLQGCHLVLDEQCCRRDEPRVRGHYSSH